MVNKFCLFVLAKTNRDTVVTVTVTLMVQMATIEGDVVRNVPNVAGRRPVEAVSPDTAHAGAVTTTGSGKENSITVRAGYIITFTLFVPFTFGVVE